MADSRAPAPPPVDTVLFDLDGTLLDTAADMAAALNKILQQQNRAPLSPDTIRPHVSKGGMALVRLGFSVDDESDRADERARAKELYDALLTEYENNICIHTKLFAGMEAVLNQIEAREHRWGVVTNKPTFLTAPLLAEMNLTARASCVVSGDTLAKRKPDPDQLVYACELLHTPPTRAVYVGDDARDIIAGQRAGTHTLAAAYGYILADDSPENWGADAVAYHPDEIAQWLAARAVAAN